jgi:hypothetical protein
VAKLDVLARFKGGEEGRSRKSTRKRLHFAGSELGFGFGVSIHVLEHLQIVRYGSIGDLEGQKEGSSPKGA